MADAINRAAQKAAGGKGTIDVKRHVHQAYYDRFLCRIFSEQDGSLLLKAAPACWRRCRTAVQPETSI